MHFERRREEKRREKNNVNGVRKYEQRAPELGTFIYHVAVCAASSSLLRLKSKQPAKRIYYKYSTMDYQQINFDSYDRYWKVTKVDLGRRQREQKGPQKKKEKIQRQ